MSGAGTSYFDSEAASAEAESFLSFAKEHFDSPYYLATHPDVAQAGVDPLEHWLGSGFREARQISRSIVLRYGKSALRSSGPNWRHFHWRGVDMAARLNKAIPSGVMSQIYNQARHDPALLAAGPDVIVNLPQVERESDGYVNAAGLQRVLPAGIECLLIVPGLKAGQGQQFAIDLLEALGKAGFRSIQTIAADQESTNDQDVPTIPAAYRKSNLIFWQDFWIRGPGSVNLAKLAYLVAVVRPRVMIVIDSRVGYELVTRFGRGLVQHTKMYCVYLDETDGQRFSARFLRWTLPFATVLTDGAKIAERIIDQYGNLLGHGVVLLPRHSPAAFSEAVGTEFGPLAESSRQGTLRKIAGWLLPGQK